MVRTRGPRVMRGTPQASLSHIPTRPNWIVTRRGEAGAGAMPRAAPDRFSQVADEALVLCPFGDGGRELSARTDLQHDVHGELGVLRLHLGLELAGGLRCSGRFVEVLQVRLGR